MMFPGSSNLSIAVEKHYPATLSKARFPLRHGTCSEIRTSGYEFVFNLNGEIKFIRGLDVTWPHPAEQLKRTDGNDWVYYTVGDISGENGIISWMGEYYLPCLPYPSNAVWDVNYFQNATIMGAFAEWSQLYGNLYALQNTGTNSRSKELVSRILQNHDGVLFERSENLHKIIGGHVSVLPPDTRHVDYEIIPVMIADGCLYHCDFCCVKSDRKFHVRDRSDILEQIQGLCRHYGRKSRKIIRPCFWEITTHWLPERMRSILQPLKRFRHLDGKPGTSPLSSSCLAAWIPCSNPEPDCFRHSISSLSIQPSISDLNRRIHPHCVTSENPLTHHRFTPRFRRCATSTPITGALKLQAIFCWGKPFHPATTNPLPDCSKAHRLSRRGKAPSTCLR